MPTTARAESSLRRFISIACACIVALVPGAAGAQTGAGWPSRAVKLIVPFPAGGATDTLARVLAQRFSADIGQPVLVDNRPGAAGAIGSDLVAKAPPDGLTLLLATSSTHSILPYLAQNLPFDPVRDFTPINQVASGASLLMVSPSLGVTTVAELVALARKRPSELNYSSSGSGSIPHLNGAYFAAQTGVRLTHVPYKGTSLAYPDLASGQVQVMFDSVVTAAPQVKAGLVRGLATTGRTRSPLVPDVPTLAEAGMPDFDSTTWFGILAPGGMDSGLAEQIAAAIGRAIEAPAVRAKFTDLGVDATADGPRAFARTIADEGRKWQRVIQNDRIRSE